VFGKPNGVWDRAVFAGLPIRPKPSDAEDFVSSIGVIDLFVLHNLK